MKPPFDITADLDTPVSAYLKLAPFRPRFLLESVEGGERLARYSFIGFGDCLEVRLDAAGLNIGEGILLQAPEVGAELKHVTATSPVGIVGQLINIGRAPLRVIDLVAQRGES